MAYDDGVDEWCCYEVRSSTSVNALRSSYRRLQNVRHIAPPRASNTSADTDVARSACADVFDGRSNHGPRDSPRDTITTQVSYTKANTGWAKNWHIVCTPYQILTDFQTFDTVSIRRKFVIILSLKISPRLKCVSTLLVSSFLKPTTDNETTSVSTHLKVRPSSSKADTSNFWCKNCRLWYIYTLDNNWDNTRYALFLIFKMCCYRSLVISSCFKTLTFHKVV